MMVKKVHKPESETKKSLDNNFEGCYIIKDASEDGCLAQLGEHRLYTAEVRGSIPLTSTIVALNRLEE